MSRMAVVAWREVLAVVRTKAFLIGLVVLPAIVSLGASAPLLLDRMAKQQERRFALVDFTGLVGTPAREKLQGLDYDRNERIRVELVPAGPAAPFPEARERAIGQQSARVRSGELFGFVVVGPRVLEDPGSGAPEAASGEAELTYGAVNLSAGLVRRMVRNALFECVRRLRLERAGLDAAAVQRLTAAPACREFRVVGEGEAADRPVVPSSGIQEELVPMAFMMLLLMGIMNSAGQLLNSTIEEKGGRVMEVLVSSVTPERLLVGKIIGASAVGLITVLVWGTSGYLAASRFDALPAGVLRPALFAWCSFYFVAGYLLFACVYAAIGSLCNTIQDAQGMVVPVMLVMLLPLIGMTQVDDHPDSALTLFLTLFPFSAPFVGTLRLGLSPPPPTWQLLLSAALLVASVCALLWGSGRIFRIAVLHQGKPPRLRELAGWLRRR